MNLPDSIRRWMIRTFRWEYWPWPVVYLPLFIQYFWQSLLSWSLTFPSSINKPFMQYGGILEESKLRIVGRIPRGWTPPSYDLPGFVRADDAEEFMRHQRLRFPLIAKPDRGMRGKGIKKLNNVEELMALCRTLIPEIPYIIQERIPYPKEIGVLMVKDPETRQWQITSLMEREYPIVTGNGRNTVEELIRQNDRLFIQLPRWKKDKSVKLQKIPEEGEKIRLDEIGNHRLGTKFIDAKDKIDEDFELAMKRICDLLKGFEYGRLDIRFHNWHSLKQLQKFSIIEVNGANSEPGHIYDPKHSIFYGWKSLLWHHRMIYRIARKNRSADKKGVSFREGLRLFSNYLRTMNIQ